MGFGWLLARGIQARRTISCGLSSVFASGQSVQSTVVPRLPSPVGEWVRLDSSPIDHRSSSLD